MRMEKKLQPASCHTHLCANVCVIVLLWVNKQLVSITMSSTYRGAAGNVCLSILSFNHSELAQNSGSQITPSKLAKSKKPYKNPIKTL